MLRSFYSWNSAVQLSFARLGQWHTTCNGKFSGENFDPPTLLLSWQILTEVVSRSRASKWQKPRALSLVTLDIILTTKSLVSTHYKRCFTFMIWHVQQLAISLIQLRNTPTFFFFRLNLLNCRIFLNWAISSQKLKFVAKCWIKNN